jgi:hypothetical protein
MAMAGPHADRRRACIFLLLILIWFLGSTIFAVGKKIAKTLDGSEIGDLKTEVGKELAKTIRPVTDEISNVRTAIETLNSDLTSIWLRSGSSDTDRWPDAGE